MTPQPTVGESVAIAEIGTARHDLSSQQRKRVYMALYQTHVPKLNEAGLVGWAETNSIVCATAETAPAVDTLDSLPLHHHVIYEIVRRHGPQTPSDLHETYERLSDSLYRRTEQTPVSERARRNKLSKLEAYDLIEVLGENRHREYKVCDSAISSKLDIEAPAQ
jgi:hypothetical protein